LAFDALAADLQNDVIEFLKSLQILPPGSKSLVVDEHGNPKNWPPSADSSDNEQQGKSRRATLINDEFQCRVPRHWCASGDCAGIAV
jgi:hypothetical protein